MQSTQSEHQDTGFENVQQNPAAATGGSRWFWWLGILILPVVVVGIYGPTLTAGFVTWDDDVFVLANPRLFFPGGLNRIWTTLAGAPGWPNYPLFYTSLWLDARLWNMSPTGFHATNVGLHAVNALLVLALLRQMGFSRAVAWVSALLFAVHPQQVESVAWIAERKNVLSGVFYLAAFLLYVRFRRVGRQRDYVLALLAFLAALLSKTASVTLVASLFLADCLIRADGARVSRAALISGFRRLLPFVVLGAIACLALAGVEAPPREPTPLALRPLVAARALWFYVGKLLLPIELTPIYPLWSVCVSSVVAWLPLLGLGLAALAIWRWRRVIGGPILWGLGHFVVTLLPIVGLVGFAYHDHSFVADRFVYLACLGLFAALAEAAARAWRRANRAVLPGVGVLVGIACGVLTWRQIPVWHDSEQLWGRAVQMNPASWMAHYGLGTQFHLRGRDSQALEHVRRCVELCPDFVPADVLLGKVLQASGDPGTAERHLRAALQRSPTAAFLRPALADVLAAQGRLSEAVPMLREIVAADRTCASAYERLAWICATASQLQWRQGADAVKLAEHAVRLTCYQQPGPLDALAAAYAETGQFARAIETAERALAVAQRDGATVLAEQIRARLAGYRASRPFRAS